MTAEDIDEIEAMHDALSRKLLSTSPEQLLDIEALDGYRFEFSDLFGERGDIINKHMPRRQ